MKGSPGLERLDSLQSEGRYPDMYAIWFVYLYGLKSWRNMKMLSILTIMSIGFFAGQNARAQGESPKQPGKDTKDWFSKKEWLGGLQLKPDKSIDEVEFARQYQLNKAFWDKAFNFLKEQDLQGLALGTYHIDGDNVYAIVTQNPTKDFDSTQWESHRNYIDLQYVISGEEKIGVSPLAKLTVTKPYDPSRDIGNYSGTGKIYMARPGTFFIFFPSDGHRPSISVGDRKADKKIVIKIRYSN
jgi:biofilm protein TabA